MNKVLLSFFVGFVKEYSPARTSVAGSVRAGEIPAGRHLLGGPYRLDQYQVRTKLPRYYLRFHQIDQYNMLFVELLL